MAASMRGRPVFKIFKNQSIGSQLTVYHRHLRTGTATPQTELQRQDGVPSYVEKPIDQINFPKRKKRDALTVLKCLAATVQQDPTAPDYIFMDDPYLIPSSKNAKVQYALSKSSGRKAARFFVDNYPDLFSTNLFNQEASVPAIPALLPKKQYQHTEASEEGLLERIEMRKVKDAIDMYEELKSQGLELSEESKISLLHLCCIYNCEDPQDNINSETLKYNSEFKQLQILYKTWKDNGPAEQIFEDLQEKTAEAYCSLIRGMAKYVNADKAYGLYNEMCKANLPVDVQTFNALIGLSRVVYTSTDENLKNIKALFESMNKRGVKPNQETFMKAIQAFRFLDRKTIDILYKIFNEMKSINMEPSLGSFYALISIVYKDKVSMPEQDTLLQEVLDYLKDKDLELVHPSDTFFFHEAMGICNKKIHSVNLAHRLNDLLMKKDHHKFMFDMNRSMAYGFWYFDLVSDFEQMDKIMEIYDQLVPGTLSLQSSMCFDLFKAIDLHDGHRYLPSLWTDITAFCFSQEVVTEFFKLAASIKFPKQENHGGVEENLPTEKQGQSNPDITAKRKLFDQLIHIIDNTVIRLFEEGKEVMYPLESKLNGEVISYFVEMSLNGDRSDLAWKYIEFFMANKEKIPGKLSMNCLTMLIEEFLSKENKDMAKECLKLMQMFKHEGTVTYENLLETGRSTISDGSSKDSQEDMQSNARTRGKVSHRQDRLNSASEPRSMKYEGVDRYPNFVPNKLGHYSVFYDKTKEPFNVSIKDLKKKFGEFPGLVTVNPTENYIFIEYDGKDSAVQCFKKYAGSLRMQMAKDRINWKEKRNSNNFQRSGNKNKSNE